MKKIKILKTRKIIIGMTMDFPPIAVKPRNKAAAANKPDAIIPESLSTTRIEIEELIGKPDFLLTS